MERTIRLLGEKNQYLEKFFALNEAEILNLEAGVFDNVPAFYRSRDAILDILLRIDEMIDVESRATPQREASGDDRAAISGSLKTRQRWVASILEQDLRILSRIDVEKSNIIRDLQSTTKARKAIGAYGRPAAGGRFDEKA